MGCCESNEVQLEENKPFKKDFDERGSRRSSKVEPLSSAYQNQNLKKTTQTKKGEVKEKGYWSDEDWSDSEEEEEKKKLNKKRKASKNKRLTELEKQMYPESKFNLPSDTFSIRTMAVSNIEPSVHIHEPIYRIKTSQLGVILKTITEKGGKVLFVPPDKQQYEQWHFAIRESDQLFPICRDGLGSSQILYLTLLGAKRTLGTSVGINLPHGAIEGYDIIEELPKQKFAVYNSKSWWNNSFVEAFGQKKAHRFGQKIGKPFHSTHSDQVRWKSDPEHSQQLKEFFDLFYYKQAKTQDGEDSEKRNIFICFQETLPIVINRLLEINKEANGLSNVTIIALPFPDETRIAENNPELKRLNLTQQQYATFKNIELYRLLAQLFIPVLKH